MNIDKTRNTVSYDCPEDLAKYLFRTGSTQQAAKIRMGRPDLVPLAEKLLDTFDRTIEMPVICESAAPYGAYAVVPEFLAGELECMRTFEPQASSSTTLNIVVDVGASCHISDEVYKRRGIAILAFVMAMGRTRPITLEIVDFNQCSPAFFKDATGSGKKDDNFSVTRCRIETNPLDLASAAGTLTDIGMCSLAMVQGVRENFGGTLAWPRFPSIELDHGLTMTAPPVLEVLNQLLQNSGEELVYIPAAFGGVNTTGRHGEASISEIDVLLNSKPEEWMQKRLDRMAEAA